MSPKPDATPRPQLDLHLYVHSDPEILTRLRVLEAQGVSLMASVQEIQAQADKVLAAVTAESDKDDAIIALVKGNTAMLADLRQQLADAIAAGADPAALQAVLDAMKAAESSALANAQKVTDAINAGTTA